MANGKNIVFVPRFFFSTLAAPVPFCQNRGQRFPSTALTIGLEQFSIECCKRKTN